MNKINSSIMIVDDEPQNLKVLENMLVSEWGNVVAFPRGEMALRAARKDPPDLVLLDIRMPGMNGYEVCEEFKSSKRLKNIPIIFLSALSETTDKIKAFEAGAVDYITKPLSEVEVLARVGTHMAKRRYELYLEELVMKRTTEIQQYAEEQKLLLDNIEIQVWYLTDPHTYGTVNQAHAEFNNLEKSDMEYRSVKSVLPENVAQVYKLGNKDVFETGRQITLEQTVEIDSDERILTMQKTPYLTSDGDVEFVVCSAEDVTQERNMEKQVRQTQKLESIGSLATGVSHDFNNLLSVIKGSAQMLQEDLKGKSQYEAKIDRIVKATDRASDVIDQLLLFSRKKEVEMEPLELNDNIERLLKMLQRLLGENIVVEKDFDDDLPQINADRGNLDQVVMNLVVNARDAMPDGGVIKIKTETKMLTYDDLEDKDEKYIRLIVEDNGTGIEQKDLEHIFDPFFTTKEEGKGTGMGLSVVYGIVKKHDGDINVESHAGQGTKFIIDLPAHEETQYTDKTIKITGDIKFDGRGRHILLIEDDQEVLDSLKEVLQTHNYRVDTTHKGSSGLKKFRLHTNKYDLVISDVILPDVHALGLVDYFKSLRNDVNILLISGYTDAQLHRNEIIDRDIPFIRKPLDVKDVLQKIEDIC
ncbi:MAG TPA: response regulator [bacterium]|nr:response regulator [bacterium]